MAKVTVLMPTYNVALYVEEAIRSVLGQTYRDFELLVIDDCSTDNTLEVVRAIDNPCIHIVQNEKNVGLAENLNRGLSLVTTDYVARMDGDDIAEPIWLEREVEILDNHPEIGICGAGFERFGASGARVRFPEHHEDIVANMLFECSVIVPTFRMSLFREHGLRYSTKAFPAEDYRFWAECLKVTKIYNIQETLFHYRMHPTQICTARREEQKHKVAEVQHYMLTWLSNDLGESEEQYYMESFLTPDIVSRKDLKEYKAFSNFLLEKNRDKKHFNEEALQRCFNKHLAITLYNTIINRYFNKGYSLSHYLRYLTSGLALKTTSHLETKLFLKSLLFKKT